MRRARSRSAVPTASQSKPQLFRLCQPMTPALPVGERKLRRVSALWAAVRQAAACHYATIYRRRDRSARLSKKFSSRAICMVGANRGKKRTAPGALSVRPCRANRRGAGAIAKWSAIIQPGVARVKSLPEIVCRGLVTQPINVYVGTSSFGRTTWPRRALLRRTDDFSQNSSLNSPSRVNARLLTHT
jgi:hypothetical protein